MSERELPHHKIAEQALLGAILLDNDVIDAVPFLKAKHFYWSIHQRIFDVVSTMVRNGEKADQVTVRKRFADDVDGLNGLKIGPYLDHLGIEGTIIVNAKEYARLVYELAQKRSLIGLGTDLVNQTFDPEVDLTIQQRIEEVEQKLYVLAETGKYGGGFKTFHEAATSAIELAGRAYMRDSHLAGLPTGLADLDDMMGGLQASDLIILAGRPGMGKTALATNIAYTVAKNAGNDTKGGIVGFFSMEMSDEQLATRVLGELAEVPSSNIRRGDIDEDIYNKLRDIKEANAALPLFIDEDGGLTVQQLAARARRLKRQNGLHLVVVDYLQLMRGSSRRQNDNRVMEVTEITLNLKALAKELNVPILALSQLSRAVEQRDDKRPQLSDLRESGSIEQDADVVMFLFREEYYHEMRKPNTRTDDPEFMEWYARKDSLLGKADLIIGKQRHGPTGTVELQFDAKLTRFSNIARNKQ